VGLLLQYLLSLAAAPSPMQADGKPKAEGKAKAKASGKVIAKVKSKARTPGKS
jgi:hypothetical protein